MELRKSNSSARVFTMALKFKQIVDEQVELEPGFEAGSTNVSVETASSRSYQLEHVSSFVTSEGIGWPESPGLGEAGRKAKRSLIG